jgi:hypothetical protein
MTDRRRVAPSSARGCRSTSPTAPPASPPVWAWHQHFNSDPEETARYLAVQDTGLVRHMRLHNIERHPTQKKIGEGADYVVDAVPAKTEGAEVQ